jgi:hypothetical protein
MQELNVGLRKLSSSQRRCDESSHSSIGRQSGGVTKLYGGVMLVLI